MDDVLESRELLGADGSSGVEAARGDADFRAHAELAPVRELRGGIMRDNRAVHLAQKRRGGLGVLGHNAIGVVGAVAFNVRDGFV